jgi:NRAMP (natural resistance-associated macrophage protein)-like metal ion transporter
MQKQPPARHRQHVPLLKRLGPGFITGASDDDPSGVATYAQTGALFGYGQLWTAIFAFPFMFTIQEMCGRIGMVTGKGLAGVLKQQRWHALLWGSIALLLIANVVNIGSNLGAMAASAEMVSGVPFPLWLIGFAMLSVGLQIFLPYKKYAEVLKYFAFTLIAYLITFFIVQQDWMAILQGSIFPHVPTTQDELLNIVAVLGTTLSPYLFFWQANEEVDDEIASGRYLPDSNKLPVTKPHNIHELRIDTAIGMGYSNLVMYFIIATSAATLGANGITEIESAAQAASALEPLAGRFASILFTIGIIGTGLLSLPVLAGSAAYALSEALGWKVGLARTWNQARGFYGIITLLTMAGLSVNFWGISPFQLLYNTAILNGLLAPPLMLVILRIGSSEKIMGRWKNGIWGNMLGWTIMVIMTLAAVALLFTISGSVGRA